ncbi:MAG: outer membrane lipoprotein carrier protein LolA [Candidatus Omnitrophica bacterium]|nr:outer membrane lipoprotein carrier protein LolA [Candidatus Omnitrophota bacterium]
MLKNFSFAAFTAFFASLTFFAVSSYASTLEQYESAKNTLEGMRAKFTQKKTFTLFEETEISAGEVWFKRPDRALWSYQSPHASTLVLNGDDSWTTLPGPRQVQKAALGEGAAERIFSILGFGKSQKQLRDSFEVRELTTQEDGMKQLELAPKEDSVLRYYTRILVRLSGKDFLPRSILLYESSGDTTEIELTDIRTGENIPDSLFALKVPEGYQLIDYGNHN